MKKLAMALLLLAGCASEADKADCRTRCADRGGVSQYNACVCFGVEPLVRICSACQKLCAPKPVAECSGNAAFRLDVCRCAP